MSIKDNLISWWELNATEGVVKDSHGANHGTNFGATRGAVGKVGNAFSFDGLDDYVDTPVNGTAVTAYTISCWLNRARTMNEQGIWHWAEGITFAQQQTPYVLLQDHSGTLRLYVNGGYRLTTAITLNTWHHIIAWYDGVNHKLYKDNALIGTYEGGVTNQAKAIKFMMGIGYRNYWQGILDETAIWDRALNTDEIAYLWNGGNGRGYPKMSRRRKGYFYRRGVSMAGMRG